MPVLVAEAEEDERVVDVENELDGKELDELDGGALNELGDKALDKLDGKALGELGGKGLDEVDVFETDADDEWLDVGETGGAEDDEDDTGGPSA